MLVLVFGLLLLPALVMALVPMFPAFWYLMLVTAVFLILDGFAHITTANLLILIGIFGLSILIDWSTGLLGAKFGGAAWKSVLYGGLGSAIGLFIVPPLGIFAGLFTGVLVGELMRRRSRTEALRAASGALIGSLAGVIGSFVLALAFIILALAFAL